MSGEADGFSGSDVPVLFELMYEALHFLAFPGSVSRVRNGSASRSAGPG